MFSAIIFGYISDKYGRKVALWSGMMLEILAGFASVFAPEIVSFTIIRFILGFGSYGRNLTAFLLAVEITGPKHRPVVGIAVGFGWATGYCLLPLIAYYVNDFRHLFLCTTAPEILWLIWLWWIPESPRWLMVMGKYAQGEKVLSQALKMNGQERDFREEFDLLKENMGREKQNQKANQNFIDMWKNPTIRIITLVFYFTWFSNAFVYYGISLNAGSIDSSSLFWNFFWIGFVEYPSHIFCMFIFKYVGRRRLMVGLMILSGVSCFTVIPFTDGSNKSLTVLVLAVIGKFCITSSYAILYVYTAEVYPTVLRQIGVGSCSVAGRIGAILAPFLKEVTLASNFGVTMGIFGGLSLLCGLLTLKLPETKDKEIPDTIEDLKKLCHDH